jgi:hypothetical protein
MQSALVNGRGGIQQRKRPTYRQTDRQTERRTNHQQRVGMRSEKREFSVALTCCKAGVIKVKVLFSVCFNKKKIKDNTGGEKNNFQFY